MKARTDLQQAGDPTRYCNSSLRGLGDTTQDLKQGTFAGAVSPNDTKNLAVLYFKINVFERPELFYLVALHDLAATNKICGFAGKVLHLAFDNVAKCHVFIWSSSVGGSVTNQITLGETFDRYCVLRHG